MKNKIIFCTYFDKNYLPKGLALHSSLLKNDPGVNLWILCMDDDTLNILRQFKLNGVTLISLAEFENPQLRSVKPTRSKVEYYWTSTPSLPLYVLNKSKTCEMVAYIDADMYFFSSFEKAIEEFGNNSIFLVEHRYPKDQIHRIETSGRFNVGFLMWRNDLEGRSCLSKWKEDCLKWCYFREEEGKMGDQMYLNKWPQLYKKVVISKNLGVNCAPWNINQYKLNTQKGDIYIDNDKLVCFHFHQLDYIHKYQHYFPYGYEISKIAREKIFDPYLEELNTQYSLILEKDPKYQVNLLKNRPKLQRLLTDLKAKLKIVKSFL